MTKDSSMDSINEVVQIGKWRMRIEVERVSPDSPGFVYYISSITNTEQPSGLARHDSVGDRTFTTADEAFVAAYYWVSRKYK
jgi:hypothetical protein